MGILLNHKFPIDWILVILTMQLFLVFMVPGFHIFKMLLAFVVHKFWTAFFMLFISHNVAAALIYVGTNKFCKKWVHGKLKGSKYYNFVCFESKKKPIQTGLIMRQIAVPFPIKNALVALGGTNFIFYLLTLWPKVIYMTSLSVFYAVSIRSLSEIYGSQKQEGESIESF